MSRSARKLGPDQALAQFLAGQGQAYSSTTFYPTRGATAVWFWLDVPARAVPMPSVLLVPYPGLNSLRLFEPQTGEPAWREWVSGDDVAASSWAIPHLFPALPLVPGAQAGRKLLLRVQNSHPVSFPWRIEERASFEASHQRLVLILGLYLRSRDRRDLKVRRAALQTRDPVTGLANDRVTRDRVEHLVQRLSMQPGRACEMHIRVGNLTEIQAEQGIQVMAGTSLHAASCLSLITREGDTVGRLKDGDFVLILERMLTEGQALQEAARVVARGLATSKRLPPGLTIRFYVALSLVAHEADNAETLPAELDLLLDDIGVAPQRVIRFAKSVNAPASRAVPLVRA